MSRFRYAQKFWLIGALVSTPFLIILFFFIAEVNRGADFARTERSGIAYIRPVYNVLDDLLQLQIRPGSTSSVDYASKVGSDVAAVDAAETKYSSELGLDTTTQYERLKSSLGDAPGQLDSEKYSRSIQEAQALVDSVSQHSMLILDPETDSYYVQDAILVKLQKIISILQTFRTISDQQGSRASSTLQSDLNARLTALSSDFNQDLQRAIAASPSLFAKLDRPMRRLDESLGKISVDRRDDTQSVSSRNVNASTALARCTEIFGAGAEALDGLLEARYDGYVGRRTTVVSITVACLLLALYLHVAFYRDTINELGRLSSGIEVLGSDLHALDFEAGDAKDEVGAVTQVLASMIATLQQEDHSRRALETQLRETQRMEAIGSLSAGIAHDFNNILHAIQGNLDLAREDLEPDHRSQESLNEIGKATQRAIEMVQQILAFSRRDLSELESVNLPDLVSDIFRFIRSGIPAGVRIHTQLSSETPLVLGNATQLHQVLVNISTNAWQSLGGRDGSVTIRTERVTALKEIGSEDKTLPPGEYAMIEVSDTGLGIPREIRDRIFEPFFTTKQRGQGTGLGLSVVQGIVKSHGGIIEVESFENEGTTFRIYLPATNVVQRREVSASVEPTPPTSSSHLSILYVDDDEALVSLVQRALKRQGLTVSVYVDARDALMAIKEDPTRFDIVFTDNNMPSMTGIEFAKAVLEIRPDLPICLTSGYLTAELTEEAKLAGIRDLIYKPNSLTTMCQAIAKYALERTVG